VKRQVISTDKGPRTGLPYSQGIRHGDLVYVAGQVALDPATGQVVAGGIREQTRQVLQNVEAILQAGGTSLAHSVECLCLLSDIGDFAAFNEVYKTFFPTDPPVRTTVGAVLPRPGLLIEIRTVAAMPPARAAARARKPARRAREARPPLGRACAEAAAARLSAERAASPAPRHLSRPASRRGPRLRRGAVGYPSGRAPRGARGGSARSARGAPTPRRRARREWPRAPRSPGRHRSPW